MPVYYYFLSVIVLLIIILLIISFVLGRKSIPVELFVKALRNENNGNLEEAVITYEIALNEVKKIRFHNGLKNKIIEKIKLLHTVIAYQKDSVFVR
jgi:ABC-type Fe3+-siderophore transport system permease subunit